VYGNQFLRERRRNPHQWWPARVGQAIVIRNKREHQAIQTVSAVDFWIALLALVKRPN
jgi:hypothetical protein